MAKFTYTLPSGDVFTLNAPSGTTKQAADKIFYEQVAAGTLVGYKVGDTLTHPVETFQKFGITRLQRGTAGVDDKTLLAVIANLPIVAPIPTTLSNTPVVNPINQADYIQVISNPTEGVFIPPMPPIGNLTSSQVQGAMAQIATDVNQTANVITQEKGVGKYGFNAIQLERAGYIKPGYPARYCPVNKNTNQNPDNFVSFMNSPVPWTGLNGVTNVNNILNNEGLQTQIQYSLMKQSYNQLVDTGTIIPPVASVTTPSVSKGQVYTNEGTLASVTSLSLFTAIPSTLDSNNLLFKNTTTTLGDPVYLDGINQALASIQLGNIPTDINSLGDAAKAVYSQGLNSLSTGAVNFAQTAVTNLSNQLQSTVSGASSLLSDTINQVASVSTLIPETVNAIAKTVTSDVSSLIGVASKFGTEATNLWANGANQLSQNLNGALSSTLNNINNSIGSTVTTLTGQLNTISGDINSTLTGINNLTKSLSADSISGGISSAMNSLGISSSFGSAFGDLGKVFGSDGGTQIAGSFTNTVNRLTLNAASIRVIGSPLITPPNYDLPDFTNLASAVNIQTAKDYLASLSSNLSNNLTLGSLGNQPIAVDITGINNIANKGINNIINGLGRFG
jgi:hypothetical protein